MIQITSANCWNDFEQSLKSLGNNEKGRAFEELTRLHLMTNPTFSTKIREIWHHSDVPQKIVDELGLQQPEIGVDLVAQVKDGTFWAIQCKFHQDKAKNVTYDELSTFLSITERDKTYPKLSHRLVCTSANGVSHRIGKAHTDKLGYLTSLEFSKLGQREFDAFRKLLDGRRSILKPYQPRDHQLRALENSESYFGDPKNSRGKIIHPCGSGKSLTGYWISQSLDAKTILIAVPSLALVRQTLGVWTREAVANNLDMDWIAVCSDEGVSNSDDPAMHAIDLGIEVDTDPDLIAKFLSDHSVGTKVLITTYQSGRAVSESVKKAGTCFDLGIYDEAHKTVGRRDKAFAHLLFDENVKVKKRVFMTATEREFKGNSDEILSMDDDDVYGTVIDHLSFKEALEQDPPILSDYKVVSTVVTKTEIEHLLNSNKFVKSDGKDWSIEGDAPTFAALIALRKLVKEHGIKHIVSFHSSIARAKEFMELNTEATKVEGSFANLTSFHVSGKDSTGDRSAELERFVNAEPSLITNARCLTEGVDVPAIDAVLFADPKQSKIDIVQAAGRALRRFDGKDFGYIIVPIVIDEGDDAQLSTAFGQIITVISALGMSDERIIEEFKTLVSGRREPGRIVDIDIPRTVTNINFQEFLSNIEILVWDRLSFAKSVIGESDFTRWMRKSTSLSEKSIKNYSQAIRKISNDLIRLKLAYSSLEELMQSEDLDRLKKEYFDIPDYKELDLRGKGMYSAGFNKLIEFHRSKHSAE
jgi:predicted helicase